MSEPISWRLMVIVIGLLCPLPAIGLFELKLPWYGWLLLDAWHAILIAALYFCLYLVGGL